MRWFILLPIIGLLGSFLAGCGNNNQPNYLVINRFRIVSSTVTAFDSEWLISDSSRTQQIYQTIQGLRQGKPAACIELKEPYSYELLFYGGGSSPIYTAAFIPMSGCGLISINNGQDRRIDEPNFDQLVSQAIGEPLEPTPVP
jgi:hypothetical protein